MAPSVPRSILLRRQANNRLPVFRLPDEILVRIFRSTDDHEGRREEYSDPYAWSKILQVCHRWYSIGLNNPLLWDTVTNSYSLDATREILSRSQSVPLHVRVGFPRGLFWADDEDAADQDQALRRRYEVPEELMKCMPRIKTLNVAIVDGIWEPTAAMGQPQMLQALTINERGPFEDAEREDLFDITTRWPFTVALPKLRDLTIALERPLCGVICIPTLRVLELELGIASDIAAYKVQDLLESMRQMPLLEQLSLHYALPDLQGTVYKDDLKRASPVHLPNLKALICDDRCATVSTLLDHIVIPTTCSLSITCEADIPEDIQAPISSLRRKLATSADRRRVIRSLEVSSREPSGRAFFDRGLHVVGCPNAHTCLCDSIHEQFSPRSGVCDDACVHVTVAYCAEMLWTALDGLPELLRVLPLQDVQTLRISGHDAYNSLKAHFGLIPRGDVATHTIPPVLADGPCHFTPSSSDVELGACLRRAMPRLTSVCLDLGVHDGVHEDFLADEL